MLCQSRCRQTLCFCLAEFDYEYNIVAQIRKSRNTREAYLHNIILSKALLKIYENYGHETTIPIADSHNTLKKNLVHMKRNKINYG